MKQTVSVVAGIALLVACNGYPSATGASAEFQQRTAASQSFGPAVDKDLALLRRVTAPYHDFAAGTAAGWEVQITPCMTDPDGAGGMGFHYGNTSLFDASASVDKPELLLYEPDKNGKLSLVAVEYIIPYTFVPRDAAPPVLFGQQFKQNDVFQLWGLHAWVWSENPSGMFADWNPRVTCDNASSTVKMSH